MDFMTCVEAINSLLELFNNSVDGFESLVWLAALTKDSKKKDKNDKE